MIATEACPLLGWSAQLREPSHLLKILLWGDRRAHGKGSAEVSNYLVFLLRHVANTRLAETPSPHPPSDWRKGGPRADKTKFALLQLRH